MRDHHYGVIIAGGKGSRFWPVSRPSRPKQLLRIVGEKSLLHATVDRVTGLFPRDRLLVVTVADHFGAIRRDLRDLPKSNFLVEPRGNNTAPCIGLAAVEITRRDPDAVMVVLPADHWIADDQAFRRAVKIALAQAEKNDALVTLGIKPEYPETGYGYILKGNKLAGSGDNAVYRVRDFEEKPATKRAARLLRRGALWNSGVFVWRGRIILEAMERYTPALHAALLRIGAARGRGLGTPSSRPRAAIDREYRKMPSVSIDYGVLEKAAADGKVLTVETRCGWSDVGSWLAVHRLLAKDERGNAGTGRWLGFRSRRCLAFSSQRLIALLGMDNTVVVDTPDAVLVGDLGRAQEVKDLVDALEREGYRRYTR